MRGREWKWVLSNLDLKGGKILDVGCLSNTYSETVSDLVKLLLEMGYEVHGVDVGKCKYKHKNFTFIPNSIQELDYPNNYFDAITCVSTIEHIGLPFYVPIHNTKVELNGDFKAMEQMRRVLKKDGYILITGPYGISKKSNYCRIYGLTKEDPILISSLFFQLKHFRIYDRHRLEKLVNGFKVVKAEFFVKKEILGGKDKLVNLPIPKIKSLLCRLDGIESFVITRLFRQERIKRISQSEAECVSSPYFPRAIFCFKLMKEEV